MVISLITIILLILLNALFVTAEFSAVAVRRTVLTQQAEAGNFFARFILPILDDEKNLENLLTMSQIGITISALFLGSYGHTRLTPIFTSFWGNLGGLSLALTWLLSILSTLLLLTALQMLFGEIIPKSLALQFPEISAQLIIVPLRVAFSLIRACDLVCQLQQQAHSKIIQNRPSRGP